MTKIEIVKKMLQHDQANAPAWLLLGMEYAEAGKRAEALQAYSQALVHCGADWREIIFTEMSKLKASNPVTSGARGAGTGEPHGFAMPSMRVIDGGKGRNQPESEHSKERVIRFADVGGLHDVKETIRMKIIQPFLTPELFHRFRKKTGGGVLLYGPPGCGKTYMAKATAGECHAKFFTVQLADILDSYLGASEQKIRELFATARAQKPAVLFFDEMDSFGSHRSKPASATMRNIIDQLLVEMEGSNPETDQLLVIGATNMPWEVDAAFKRPGRFDKMIFMAPPDVEAREAIFRLKLAGRPVEAIDFHQLAAWTDLYSGADIEYVVELATEQVLQDILTKGIERPIQMNDLRESIAASRPSTIEWLRTVKSYVKYANQDGRYDDVENYLARNNRV